MTKTLRPHRQTERQAAKMKLRMRGVKRARGLWKGLPDSLLSPKYILFKKIGYCLSELSKYETLHPEGEAYISK